eukprot:s1571_g16.t1
MRLATSSCNPACQERRSITHALLRAALPMLFVTATVAFFRRTWAKKDMAEDGAGMMERVLTSFFGFFGREETEEKPRISTFYWNQEKRIVPRLEEEVSTSVQIWHSYVHPRVRKIFSFQEVDAILFQLARNVNKDEDPITGGSEDCVLWHGDITVNDKMEVQAALCIVHKDRTKTVGFTNRLLSFIFADDDSYAILQNLPATKVLSLFFSAFFR